MQPAWTREGLNEQYDKRREEKRKKEEKKKKRKKEKKKKKKTKKIKERAGPLTPSSRRDWTIATRLAVDMGTSTSHSLVRPSCRGSAARGPLFGPPPSPKSESVR